MQYTTKFIENFWKKVVIGEPCWSWNGSKAMGYGKMSRNGTTVYAHRISYEVHYGPIPDGMVVDHTCFTRECTNPAHLRLLTYKQNTEHRSGPNINSQSGHTGVTWRSDIRRWKGTVRVGKTYHHLGYFDDPEECAVVVRAKRNELFTHNDRDR